MAFDGVKILDNDLACDVHDAFFEAYDGGADPAAIRAALVERYDGELNTAIDGEVFATAMAECLWSVGRPVDDLAAEVREGLAAESTRAFWGDLYDQRRRVLDRFLAKLAKPKPAPLPRKKTRVPKHVLFEAGDWLLFEKRSGRLVPAVVWAVEPRGRFRYDFVFPNLSRPADPALVLRVLRGGPGVTDDEVATFFSPNKRARVTTIEHTAIRAHAGRFRKVGHRPFVFPTWQGSGFGYAVTFADFERAADDAGSRALTPEEVKALTA